jgi:hypothetical protein
MAMQRGRVRTLSDCEAQAEGVDPPPRTLHDAIEHVGFILARHVMKTADLERHNAAFVGGAITGGANDLFQLFTRPVARLNPYTTPNPPLVNGTSKRAFPVPAASLVRGSEGRFKAR